MFELSVRALSHLGVKVNHVIVQCRVIHHHLNIIYIIAIITYNNFKLINKAEDEVELRK